MANEVYANGMELACKAGSGKVIAAFPDVCMTPPENPATPPGVPVPYPNTAMASDTADGSRTVKISGEEVMLKNKSYFKKSTGDEAGCAAKKGVISSKNTGKVYFTKWSMDVKIEGENVDRHLDLTTNNHGSPTANEAVPWPYFDSLSAPVGHPCHKDKAKEEDACEAFTPYGKEDACIGFESPPKTAEDAGAMHSLISLESNSAKCLRARRCQLVPKSPQKKKKQPGCCPGQTGHHLIEDASIRDVGGYNYGQAPCVCVSGINNTHGSHGFMHTFQSVSGEKVQQDGRLTVDQAAEIGAKALLKVFKESGCNEDCIKSQIIKGHRDMGIERSQEIQHKACGARSSNAVRAREIDLLLKDYLTGAG